MDISTIPNALRVGEIVESNGTYSGTKHVLYSSPLGIIFDANFPQKLKRKHVSLVYIFCVEGEIFKIGQSSTASGISGCLNFYLKAGMDDPGINRFAINWLMREKLKEGKKVEVYMIYMDPIIVEVPGLFSPEEMIVPVSAKGMEENCLKQYKGIENKFPEWNYQESGTSLPSEIHVAFGQYKKDRKEKSN